MILRLLLLLLLCVIITHIITISKNKPRCLGGVQAWDGGRRRHALVSESLVVVKERLREYRLKITELQTGLQTGLRTELQADVPD